MYTFLSKSEGVPFQALGDLTWNDPNVIFKQTVQGDNV